MLVGRLLVAGQEPLEPDEGPDGAALELLEQREAARRDKDFAAADARRDELEERGWVVRDTPEGPQLVRRR